MNYYQEFKHDIFGKLGVIKKDNQAFLVGRDVARILGYKYPINVLKEYCKNVDKAFVPTNGGEQLMNVIPKSDVIRLITKSSFPWIDHFEKWVFNEIVPTIEEKEKIKMNHSINIIEHHGIWVVGSRQVAEDFGKRHAHVIEKIEEKLLNRKIGSANWFIESTYKDSTGRHLKEYLLTRDGFSFIVMGFTGSRADEFKINYINAFNQMEEKLKVSSKAIETLTQELALLRQDLTVLSQVPATQTEPQDSHAPENDTLYTAESIAGELGISSARALNNILNDLGVQYYQKGHWLLYKPYKNKGYKDMSTKHKSQRWTLKGKKFIEELLSEVG